MLSRAREVTSNKEQTNMGEIAADIEWSAEVEALRAQVARLREALRPFVQHYESWMDDYPDSDQSSMFSRHTFGQLREARAALDPSTEYVQS
jgi:hypothetical protein